MVFNATFKNISAISWQSVLLVEDTGLPEEKNPTDLSLVIDKFDHIMLHRVHHTWAGFELTTLVVIGTDCIDICKSNYNMLLNISIRYYIWNVTSKRYTDAGG
jgi:hypothetical protein